ncbi:MAG: SPASM domain-containing protein [Defluviitaleaceae bacterium]|nr:SPASM domain-containing protein [Defluviitaleaceae bacterium]
MKSLSIMIKPTSSLCNLQCTYCFYSNIADSRQQANFGLMSLETAKALIDNIFCLPLNYVSFGFQGGEPTLVGLDFYKFFVEEISKKSRKVPKLNIRYAFQTNGLLLDENWLQFFRKHKFLVGLSVDGDAQLHNANRLDKQGKSTHSKVISKKKLLDLHKVDYNILCVLTKETSRRANRIWDFILRENIEYIQFIPCLESLETADFTDFTDLSHKTATNFAALTSEKFYRFYADLFPLWKKSAENGHFVHIQLFEDLATLMLSNYPVTCGMCGNCTTQIVAEADGSVFPCDFYALDAYKMGNLAKQPITEIIANIDNSGFLASTTIKPKCNGCNYLKWCNGGCKRMQKAVYGENGENGENCGMKSFLDAFLADLLAVYRRIIEQNA